jgi:hypothetical protein
MSKPRLNPSVHARHFYAPKVHKTWRMCIGPGCQGLKGFWSTGRDNHVCPRCNQLNESQLCERSTPARRNGWPLVQPTHGKDISDMVGERQ